MYEQNVIDALAALRDLGNLSLDEREAFQALDDAGVFAAIDEQAQTAQAEEILAEAVLPAPDSRTYEEFVLDNDGVVEPYPAGVHDDVIPEQYDYRENSI
jgi:hypothetical protein